MNKHTQPHVMYESLYTHSWLHCSHYRVGQCVQLPGGSTREVVGGKCKQNKTDIAHSCDILMLLEILWLFYIRNLPSCRKLVTSLWHVWRTELERKYWFCSFAIRGCDANTNAFGGKNICLWRIRAYTVVNLWQQFCQLPTPALSVLKRDRW